MPLEKITARRLIILDDFVVLEQRDQLSAISRSGNLGLNDEQSESALGFRHRFPVVNYPGSSDDYPILITEDIPPPLLEA